MHHSTSSSDLVSMDAFPVSLWVDTVTLDLDTKSTDATLSFGSPTSPMAMASSAKSLTGEFFFLGDAPMLDFDEESFWGTSTFSDDDQSSESTKQQLLEVDGSWVTVELSDAIIVKQKTAVLSLEAPSTDEEQLSPPSPAKKTRAATAAASKKTSKKVFSPKTTKSPPAKVKRQRKHKYAIDPKVRVHQRKTKQRGYERNYRGRLRDQRCQDEFEWLRCEAELRKVLSRKRALLLPPPQEQDKTSPLVQLVHEERALKEERVYLQCICKWLEALDIWGVETEASRNIRYEINALPQVRGMPVFTDFTW